MAGIDAKTLAAAQQYAEQLGLGGAGLQEKVNEQVNVYLAENLYPVIDEKIESAIGGVLDGSY